MIPFFSASLGLSKQFIKEMSISVKGELIGDINSKKNLIGRIKLVFISIDFIKQLLEKIIARYF